MRKFLQKKINQKHLDVERDKSGKLTDYSHVECFARLPEKVKRRVLILVFEDKNPKIPNHITLR